MSKHGNRYFTKEAIKMANKRIKEKKNKINK